MKRTRRHSNTTGLRQIKNGSTRKQVRAMARRIGVPHAPRCMFRFDSQTVCGRTIRHGSHDRWNRGDRSDSGQNMYSHPFQVMESNND